MNTTYKIHSNSDGVFFLSVPWQSWIPAFLSLQGARHPSWWSSLGSFLSLHLSLTLFGGSRGAQNWCVWFSFQITTPSKRYLEFGYLQTKPFYREPWFLVALAAASIVIIIMIVAILCVKSKTYKYKGEFVRVLVASSCQKRPPSLPPSNLFKALSLFLSIWTNERTYYYESMFSVWNCDL